MSPPSPSQMIDSLVRAFPPGSGACRMTLKEANDVDSYRAPSGEADAVRHDWQRIPDSYLEQYHWGLAHLDPDSWMFYLPAFLSYSIRHSGAGSTLAVDACLSTLRPPDREPPRLKALDETQRQVVRAVLEDLAFDEHSAVQLDACQVLEEYWIENPLYGDA